MGKKAHIKLVRGEDMKVGREVVRRREQEVNDKNTLYVWMKFSKNKNCRETIKVERKEKDSF